MPKQKKGAKKARNSKIGFFLVLFGTDPVDSDNIPDVTGTLAAAIDEAKDRLDENGDVFTVYELVPRARVEQPELPAVIVKRL
jgi:hypothetical protein